MYVKTAITVGVLMVATVLAIPAVTASPKCPATDGLLYVGDCHEDYYPDGSGYCQPTQFGASAAGNWVGIYRLVICNGDGPEESSLCVGGLVYWSYGAIRVGVFC
jgi:hypothetical protein